MNQPVPEVLRITAEFVLNNDLKRTLEADQPDVVRIAMLMEIVKREGVKLEETGLAYIASHSLNRLMRRFQQEPQRVELLDRVHIFATIMQMCPLSINYWEAQNIFYSVLKRAYPVMARKTDSGSRIWREKFLRLGEILQVSVPRMEPKAELQLAS